MNDNHSRAELRYKPRWIKSLFASAIADHSIVVLTGARQTGKSTFLQNSEPVCNWRYLTMDDYDLRDQARINPASLWAGADRVVIDEVQHSPEIFSAVKMSVDEKKGTQKFVLTGSANLLLMHRVSETLAGRAVYFELQPMTLGEMNGRPSIDILNSLLHGDLPQDGVVEKEMKEPFQLIVKGFMPSLLSFSTQEPVLMWWEGYIATYLERDLREISRIESLIDFRKVMAALAFRNGQMLNQTEIARDVGVSQASVHRYINLLEATYLAERLPAYSLNRTKRLIKSPKFYWIDSGLGTFLAGFHDADDLKSSREAGAFFETMIFHHLKALSTIIVPKARIYYWRTVDGKEVDFVLEQGRRLLAIEVKLTDSPKYADIKGLRLFLQEYPEAVLGVLLYNGAEIKRMDEKIVALPWTLIAG